MDRSGMPAPYLVKGLHRLVQDLNAQRVSQVRGLTGLSCGETRLISFDNSQVQYCGQDVSSLAARGSFEEVTWLLLAQRSPTDEQLADIQAILAEVHPIDSAVAEMLERIPLRVRPLEIVPIAVSLHSFFDPSEQDENRASMRSAIWNLLSHLPDMLSSGINRTPCCDADRDSHDHHSLSWAGRVLQALRGDDCPPTTAEDFAINAVMICQCLTEMRAACFASRLVGSTTSHVRTAIQVALTLFVAQLRKDPFIWSDQLLRELTGPASAEAWWKGRANREMPFGFADGPEDPRVPILRDVCRSLLGSHSRIVVEASACRLERLLADQQLCPTVDWLAARALTLLNVPGDRQSVVIALARLAGWAAQAIEQNDSQESLLPVLQYGSAAVLAGDEMCDGCSQPVSDQ